MIPHPIITAALFLTAYPAAAATLLLNPGFEANVLAPATNITVTDADFEGGETSPQVTPWAAGGNSVYLASAGVNSGVWGTSTRFDTQFVVLSNFSDGATFSSLAQSFTLGAAGTFNFSLDWESAAFTEENANGYSAGGGGKARVTGSGDQRVFLDSPDHRRNCVRLPVQQVLCEGPSKTNKQRLTGRTGTNKILIFDGDVHKLTGRLLDIRVEESTGFTLYGSVVEALRRHLAPSLAAE